MFRWRLRLWVGLILVVLAVPLPSHAVSGVGMGDDGRIDAISFRTEWHMARWPDQPVIHHGDSALDVISSQKDAAELRRTNLPRFTIAIMLAVIAASSLTRRRAVGSVAQIAPAAT
jgi:hypothetical protein